MMILWKPFKIRITKGFVYVRECNKQLHLVKLVMIYFYFIPVSKNVYL